ncbi:hypothetical protein Agub_g1450 [Astrephomene gubernaculifera]|uniref:RING-type domain-containing protein n=1 Tax=Astrephomene gubernaculifera TaxID=47775 RepID=A0AAD3DHZ4_9CHLO|nr:hypothetical protein Agub_g1450 [Astrephomene gubernaculifera]
MWLMPALISVHLRFYRFLVVWAIFSAIAGRLIWTCAQKKMSRTTPRRVYTFFLGLYRVCKVVGVTGYAFVLAEMFGLGPLLHLLFPKDLAIDLVWYGLYFGILGRDCAQVATDSLSSRLGMEGRQLATRINNCGICGNELCDELVPVAGTGEEPVAKPSPERTVQLSCKHCFHDLCIRGWTMVGKKDTCPQCSEKVDLRSILADRPWETHNITWIQMMDGIRYLVVWNPIIFTALSFLLHIFGPHRHNGAHGVDSAPLVGPPGLHTLGNATLTPAVLLAANTSGGVNLTHPHL